MCVNYTTQYIIEIQISSLSETFEHFANEPTVSRNPHSSSHCDSPALDNYTAGIQTHRLSKFYVKNFVSTQKFLLLTFPYNHNLLTCRSSEDVPSFILPPVKKKIRIGGLQRVASS